LWYFVEYPHQEHNFTLVRCSNTQGSTLKVQTPRKAVALSSHQSHLLLFLSGQSCVSLPVCIICPTSVHESLGWEIRQIVLGCCEIGFFASKKGFLLFAEINQIVFWL